MRVRLTFKTPGAWNDLLSFLVDRYPSADIDVVIGTDIILDNDTFNRLHSEFANFPNYEERLFREATHTFISARDTVPDLNEEEYQTWWASRGQLRTPHGTDLNTLDRILRDRAKSVMALYKR